MCAIVRFVCEVTICNSNSICHTAANLLMGNKPTIRALYKHSIIIIIVHLLKRISLTVNQSSCCFTLIDMIINRHVKFNMIKTQLSRNIYIYIVSIK